MLQTMATVGQFGILGGDDSQVELGVELGDSNPDPLLASDVYACCGHAHLGDGLSVSSCEIPRLAPANGTAILLVADIVNAAQELRAAEATRACSHRMTSTAPGSRRRTRSRLQHPRPKPPPRR